MEYQLPVAGLYRNETDAAFFHFFQWSYSTYSITVRYIYVRLAERFGKWNYWFRSKSIMLIFAPLALKLNMPSVELLFYFFVIPVKEFHFGAQNVRIIHCDGTILRHRRFCDMTCQWHVIRVAKLHERYRDKPTAGWPKSKCVTLYKHDRPSLGRDIQGLAEGSGENSSQTHQDTTRHTGSLIL